MSGYVPDALSDRWANLSPEQRAAAAAALRREMPIRFRRPAVMRAAPKMSPAHRQGRKGTP